jgi:purine catabolism regulator
MPPTLASLVHRTALRLGVRTGHDRLEAEVHWAHVSELEDPVPYMEGGELLLTTAMKLDAENSDAMRRYVRRLAGAGVVGLGFAVGVTYDDIPEALVAAAQEEGMPLLEVPRRTPFIAISKAVSAAIAAEQYQAVTTGFDAQRDLTRAVLGGDGPGALLARLAAHVHGWAALYDASGALVAAAPGWAARRAARLTDDVERLRERPAPATAVAGGSDDERDRVELQSLGTGRHARGVLAVGTGAPLGTAERYAVNSAVALLTLSTERSRTLREVEQRLAAAVLRMLLSGEPDHARSVAGGLYGGLLDAPFRMIVAEPVPAKAPSGGAIQEPPDVLGALADALESAAARGGEPVLVVPEDGRLVALAPEGGAAVAACMRFARQDTAPGPTVPGRDDLAVGLSAATGPAAAASAHRQAEQALSVARRRGRSLVEHDQIAAGSVLPLLADDAVRAFADGMLRALREHDATGRGDLVASLQAWLARHGQWDAAAADLGVHRHTLRYRMRRVEDILGRSLDDPDVRMELWLALKVTPPPPD